MKPLDQLNNVEKARLLYDLFPEEIPQFVDYVLNVCEFIQQDKEKLKERWGNPFMSLDMWLSLAKDTEARIIKYGPRLRTSGKLFSEQLFDGYNTTVLSHCLGLFVTTQHLGNRKFSLATDLLFSTSDYLNHSKK